MPDPSPDRAGASPSDPKSDNQLGDTVKMIKDYARQETLGPLKGWARYLALGAAGAFVLGIGLVVTLLGVLRLLQTDTHHAFTGPNMSIVAYLITLVACVVIVGIAYWQIQRRTTLQRKEPNR